MRQQDVIKPLTPLGSNACTGLWLLDDRGITAVTDRPGPVPTGCRPRLLLTVCSASLVTIIPGQSVLVRPACGRYGRRRECSAVIAGLGRALRGRRRTPGVAPVLLLETAARPVANRSLVQRVTRWVDRCQHLQSFTAARARKFGPKQAGPWADRGAGWVSAFGHDTLSKVCLQPGISRGRGRAG